MSKTADLFIKNHIEIMWGGLEMASIQHFVYTGKVNGSFRQRLTEMLEGFAANWHNTAAEKQSSQLEESHIKAREMSAKEIEELREQVRKLREGLGKLREGLDEADVIFAHLEDFTHGKEGEVITHQRGKIKQLLNETK